MDFNPYYYTPKPSLTKKESILMKLDKYNWKLIFLTIGIIISIIFIALMQVPPTLA